MIQTATVKELPKESPKRDPIVKGNMPLNYTLNCGYLGYVILGNPHSSQIMLRGNSEGNSKIRPSEAIVPVEHLMTPNENTTMPDFNVVEVPKSYSYRISGISIELYEFDASLIPTGNSEKEKNAREHLFQSRPDLVQLVDIHHPLPPMSPRYQHPNPSANIPGI